MANAAATFVAEAPARRSCARNPVEETHRGFAQSKRALPRRLRGERGQKIARHRPGIEIDALPPRRRGMEGRVDIIGTGLEADHVDAARRNARRSPSVASSCRCPSAGRRS